MTAFFPLPVPSFVQISSYSLITASFGLSLLKMWERIVSSGQNAGVCGKKETLQLLLNTTFPSSGVRTPAMQFKSVDFPVPLRPTRAALSPSFSPNVTSVKSGFSRPIFASLLIERRFMQISIIKNFCL